MDTREHWNAVYESKGDDEVSWTEAVPDLSLRMLEAAGLHRDSCVVDIGGGNSRLVDELVGRGLECLAVLDVAPSAVERVKGRLGARADVPTWIIGDVTKAWHLKPMDIWHDRAVFHFLTTAEARARYRVRLVEMLKPGGAAVVSTFALDGPERCSGLPVERYSPQTLAQEFTDVLTLIESAPYRHTTPWGASQSFQYSRFVRL
jgi:SAM-dependent methyltransferase